MNIINTNTRSLCPKVNSLVDCYEEMNIACGMVTETWLTDGEGLEEDVEDVMLGAGMGFHCLNRLANLRGCSHRGVAVLYREGQVSLTPGEYEVLVTAGALPVSYTHLTLPTNREV